MKSPLWCKHRFSWSAVLTILLCTISSLSQTTVVFSDTSLKAGQLVQLPITGSLRVASTDTVDIQIRYSSNLLDVKNIVRGMGFPCEPSIFSIAEENEQSSIITVRCTNPQSVTNGTFFSLSSFLLLGTDTIASIAPISIKVNSKEIVGASLTAGKVTYTNAPIILPQDIEYFSKISPNPFQSSTSFQYYVPEVSDVTFTLFNVIGAEVYSETLYSVAKGRYTHTFTLPSWDLSSGLYHIRMKTNNTVSVRDCVVIK